MRLQSQNRKRTTIIIIVVVAVILIAALVVGAVLLLNKPEQPAEEMKPTDVVGIEISSKPSQTVYHVGGEFDPTGTRIQVLTHDYSKSYFVDVSELTFSGFDSSEVVEEQVITVSYRGFTTTFTVQIKEPVSDNTPYLVSIEPKDLKTTYPKDEWNTYGPDYNGASLLLNYSDGTTESVWIQNSWATQREIMDAPGKTYITIEYMGKSIEVEFTITD